MWNNESEALYGSKLSVWGRKKEQRKEEKVSGVTVRHSKAYHRYFEGYCERKVEKEDGSCRIERVYTGNYYRQDLTETGRIGIRVVYICLYLVGWVLFAFGGTRDIGSNLFLVTIAAQMVSVCLLIWMFFLLISYLAAKREMEIRVYRETSEKLRQCAKFLSISMPVVAAASALYMLIWSTEPVQELYCIIPNLGAGLVFFLMRAIEEGIPYVTRPSGHQRMPGEFPIEL